MAVTYSSGTIANGASIGGRVFGALATLFGTFADWNDTRATRNALRKLSDRELDDIGLCRQDIERI
ncbi:MULTISPECIES: DUF1127 domain-containing protein [Falsihalocynthiibacter]|uniref:DUF1127 domain-containing protein n=1 Tax=Falsihalocynthiibacter TaxID=2854182 RepID=UPI00300270B4